MEGTHPLIDVLIHLVIYVTVCNASNVCRLLMTGEPLKMPVSQIQEKLRGKPPMHQRTECKKQY